MNYDLNKILSAFRKNERESFKAASHLRTKVDIRIQIEVLTELNLRDDKCRKLLVGNLFADNWSDIFAVNNAPTIGNSQKAINWHAAVFEVHVIHLRKHSEMELHINHKALLGHWEEVRIVLLAHQEYFGPTLWGLAWLFLLNEEQGGATARRKLLDRFKQDGGENLAAFASLLSISADKNISEEQFVIILNRMLSGLDNRTKHFFKLLLAEDNDERAVTTELLDQAEFLTLVDRYEFFLRVCTSALEIGNEDSAKLQRAVYRTSKLIHDPRFRYVATIDRDSAELAPSDDSIVMVAAWDAYVVSDYLKCYELCEQLIARTPYLFPPCELLTKSAIYLQKEGCIPGGHPLALIIQHLHNVYAKNDRCEESLTYLRRLARRFKIFSLNAPLRALHTQQLSLNPNEKWSRRASYAYGVITPRNFEYGHSAAINQSYLELCSQKFPHSIAINFFNSLSKSIETFSLFESIPVVRHYFFGGLDAERHHMYGSAIQRLETFLDLQLNSDINPLSPFSVEEARRVLVDLYVVTQRIPELLKAIVQAYLQRSNSIRRLQLHRAYSICESDRQTACQYIEFPIIAYLACDEPHDVTLALKRYLRFKQVTKPSEIIYASTDEIRVLATFLLRVCSPEVLDSLLALDSVEKVEAERITILNWVTRNETLFARTAETEILRLTQNAQLREALQKLEGARIVLNIAGLREAEQQRFAEAYSHYSAQRELVSQLVNETMTFISVVRKKGDNYTVYRPEIPNLRDSRLAELKAFILAFREIRDAFVSSPHFGIEACLSGRIRHGILIQHLRKALLEKQLAVRREASETPEIEKYWTSRLRLAQSSKTVADVMDTLYAMTEQVDRVAEEVRDSWIQVKTETRNSAGLFDYSFSDIELDEILAVRMGDTTTAEMFLDRIFDVLLERTRQSLRLVQERIKNELLLLLTKPIDRALNTLSSLLQTEYLLPLRNDLVACRSETERACQQMARWFQYSDATLMGDVDFELIAHTAVGMVERLNPDYRNHHVVFVQPDQRVRGRFFTALVHILFFLLENAVRYAGVTRERFNSTVRVNVESRYLVLSVDNETRSAIDAESAASNIQARVAQLKQNFDPAKVVKEGGSGFAKMIAAVRYEFKQRDPIIEAVYTGSHLCVTIKCEAIGLCV